MTAHDDAHDAGPPAAPWASAAGDGGVACVILWTTGTDVRMDRLVRIAAVRPDLSEGRSEGRAEGSAWESIERTCCDAADDGEAALARVRVDFGLAPEDLARAPRAAEAWSEVREFLGDHPVVTLDGALLDAWARSLDAAADVTAPPLRVVGLEDFAGLLEPGHLCSLSPPRLIGALLEPALAPEPPAAVHPPHALAALAELVARFADLGPAAHALGKLAWTRALEGLRGEDLAAASRLAIALDLVDRPSLWAGDGGLFAAGRLRDGVLSTADAESLDEDDPLALMEPAVADLVGDSLDGKPLEADTEDPAPFVDEDLALLDDLFRVHLPGQFAATAAERASGELYRKSQHRVAEEVARSLGSDELLLVHAPTGTGKTLAYLLPALLWSRRYDVRVGVATYTRALQSQAMEREVPRALSALASAGVPPGFRVSVLKGREHSLCWRALRIHAPRPSDDPETWLAWTALALFGLRDGEGDLDRFPRRSPVRLMGAGAYRSALRALLDLVRGRSGCCTAQADRGVCAAEVARRRAERSHVVLTNQSFALARPEFFRRVVFDECEHLHDQAMSAWSHRVSFPEIRRVLTRLHEPGPKGTKTTRNRPPLDRLAGKLPTGSAAREQLDAARALWSRAASELSRLEAEVLEYERWRSEAVLGRGESELHGLFREYVEGSDAASGLVDARTALQSALARLDGSLAQLAEELEVSGVRRVDRIRRTLERSRVDLAGVGEAVAAWLPLDDGAP
ncbi:MAG: DEAD/DEAH box helicase, partial [Planctomycetota bacterium]